MRDEWSIDAKCFVLTPSPLMPSAIIFIWLKLDVPNTHLLQNWTKKDNQGIIYNMNINYRTSLTRNVTNMECTNLGLRTQNNFVYGFVRILFFNVLQWYRLHSYGLKYNMQRFAYLFLTLVSFNIFLKQIKSRPKKRSKSKHWTISKFEWCS
jgi:hypothetical protein